MTRSPALSVIIASVDGAGTVKECLDSLARQRGQVGTEIIVADVTGEATARLIEQQFPLVELLSVRERRTIPQLRAAGLARSRGEIVAVIEDHCLADEFWCEKIVEAHRAFPACVAVGGAVENGSPRLVDWAVFFCEYSAFMRPLPRGASGVIPGNNVSYKRRAFDGMTNLEGELGRDLWEFSLHRWLSARGECFVLDPAVVVYHNKRFGVRYFLSQRFHYSRHYAGALVAGWSPPRRWARGGMSLVLPPLLLARIATRVLRKRRHVGEFVLSLPLLGIFLAAWAVGELAGCLFGPGRSLYVVE